MLLNGVNHVAILTHDTGRLAAFYREVFDAEIGSHLQEFDGAVQLTFIRIGQTAELNVFQAHALRPRRSISVPGTVSWPVGGQP